MRRFNVGDRVTIKTEKQMLEDFTPDYRTTDFVQHLYGINESMRGMCGETTTVIGTKKYETESWKDKGHDIGYRLEIDGRQWLWAWDMLVDDTLIDVTDKVCQVLRGI